MKFNSPKRPEFCRCCVVNHDIIFSPFMIFFFFFFLRALRQETNAISNTRFSSRSRNKPNKNQELTLSTKPVTLHAAFAPMLSRDQKGDPHLKPPSLSSYSAGMASPDERVAAVLQRRLHPTRSRGHWCCNCCCCCCCRCYCHAATSCRCSSGPPADTRYRDRREGWMPPSRRRFHQRTQLLTRAL